MRIPLRGGVTRVRMLAFGGVIGLALALVGAPSALAQEPDAKVLIYTGTVAHRHAATISQGIGPIQDALDAANIAYDWEDCDGYGTAPGQCHHPDKNPRIFTDENLSQYDAIFLFNAGGNEPGPLFDEEQRDAIRRFVNNGGGIAANHLATDMGAGQVSWGWWDGVGNSALGTTMPGHPPSPQTATMFVTDRNHPSTKDLPESFEHSDEHYHFTRSVRGTHHVLISLDESDIDYPAGSNLPMGHDHPVSWCRLYDGGRIWATAMGHYPENYTENGGDNFLIKHLVGGVRWAAGVAGTEGDCGGTIWSNFRRVTISTNVQGPIGLDVAEDGRVFWTEIGPQGLQSFGRLKMWDPGTGDTTLVAQIPTRADALSTSEDGVLGMVLDPDFEENNRLYVYYSPRGEGEDWPMTGTGHALGYNLLSRFTLNDEGTQVVDEQPILKVPKVKVAPNGDGIGNPGSPNWPAHSGGAGLEFDAEGNLYLGVGDDVNPYGEGQNGYAPMDERFEHRYDARNTSANTNDLRGKILRIKPLDEIPDGAEPGIGTTYEIPEGNMFEPGTPNTKPEIYAMGFRQPFTLDSDPANPGTIVVGEYGPDAGQGNPQRGPAGVVEWNHITGPGFYGWPFCTGDNSPSNTYARYEYATGTPGAFYDCQADTVPNESPHNTGFDELPKPIPADLWFRNGGGHPAEFNLGPSSGEPNSGAIYRYDPDNPSERKWPAYYDGSWLVLDRAHSWWREVRMKEDGSGPLRVNNFFQPNQFGTPTHNFAIPVEFGPDGALYLGLWTGGCCRTLSEQQGRIVRIDYVGDQADQTPPEVGASVDGTQNDAGAYIDRATVRFNASDDIAGVREIEYRVNGGDWETLDNDNFSEPFRASFTLEEPGSYTVEYRATDRSNNTSDTGSLKLRVADGSSCTYELSDEFHGPEIDERWTVRVDSPQHEARIENGQLILPVLDEVDGDRTGPLAFVGQQVPDGEWSITTRVTIDHQTNWQQAGLMLWQSDANFVKVGFTTDGPSKGQRRFEVTADDPNNVRHFSTSLNVGADFPNTAWIRMYREGDLVKAEVAEDVNGQPGQWQKLPGERAVKGNDPDNGALINPPREGPGVLVGPYAGGHLDGPWNLEAAFDFVRFAGDEIDCPPDTDPPSTSVQLNGEDPVPSYDGDVDVALKATDGLDASASGVADTEYRVDGGDWETASNDDGDDPFVTEFEVSGDGEHTVEFRSTDAAGNTEETRSVTFEIGGGDPGPDDTTPPQTTATLDPAQPGPGGTYNQPVTVNFLASDPAGGDGGPDPQTHEVGAVGFNWDPSELEITQGDSVHWDWTEGGAHDLCLGPLTPVDEIENLPTQCADGFDLLASNVVLPNDPAYGTEATRTFDEPGTWTFYCSVHFPTMSGTIEVQPASGGAEPSGVAYTEYRVNGGEWVQLENTGGDEPFASSATFTEPGSYVVEYRSADVAGNVEETKQLSFEIAEPPVGPVPVNLEPPTISGNGKAGTMLTCNPGTWTAAGAYTYTWLRDSGSGFEVVDNRSTNPKRYRTAPEDVGSQVACRVTRTNAHGTSAPAQSQPVTIVPKDGSGEVPENTTPPALTDSAGLVVTQIRAGRKLKCERGEWTGTGSYAYIWLRDGEEFANPSTNPATYNTTVADIGSEITCVVTRTGKGGTSEPAESQAVLVTP